LTRTRNRSSSEWACQENVVSCPEKFFFTADQSGTNSPLDSLLDSAVQRETVIVSQNDSSKRLLFDSANDDSGQDIAASQLRSDGGKGGNSLDAVTNGETHGTNIPPASVLQYDSAE